METPNTEENEKALLGSILVNPESITKIMDIIDSKDFFIPKHQKIYQAMLEIVDKGNQIDNISLADKLKQKKELEAIGGNKYIFDLMTVVPTASNIEYYAEQIKQKSVRRNLVNVGENIINIARDETLSETEEIIDKADEKLYQVTSAKGFAKTYNKIKNLIIPAMERFNKLSNEKNVLRGVNTGFESLNNLLAGFQKGDLVIIAARPSVGKTALALDIARRSAINHGHRVGIFSLEMSSEELVDRMINSQARTDAWKYRTGKISGDSFQKITQASSELENANIFIDDDSGKSTLSLRSTARRMKKENDIDLLIVDYLQLITPHKRQSADLVQQVTEVSRTLKQIARELKIPVIALSQLSRNIESRGGKPKLSDLRDSGAIEQDADVVMFIHKDKRNEEAAFGDPVETEILVEKHRNGPIGAVKLIFNPKQTSFSEIDKYH